jgi:hypothetical protein
MTQYIYPTYCITCGERVEPMDVACSYNGGVQCWECDWKQSDGQEIVSRYNFEANIPKPYIWMD